MKRVFGLITLTLTINITIGQKHPTQIKYTQDTDNSCGQITLGSGFEKSGMVQYVARPKIIESKWNGRQLTIKIFVVSECCPPDYLGYIEQSDTLNLYYGQKINLPNKDGLREEFEICMCGYNGCCYEFEYVINGLSPTTNYMIAISDVAGIGLIKPYPIGYIDNQLKSIHYSNGCNSLEVCLDNEIKEAVSSYKQLGSLYDSLIALHEKEGPNEREMIDRIAHIWIAYFASRKAIYDEFIQSKMDKKLYDLKTSEFESKISNELELLEPRLNIVTDFLNGGTFTEPIKEIKIKKD